MTIHLEWDSAKKPAGARDADFGSEGLALAYVRSVLPHAQLGFPWLDTAGADPTFQYKFVWDMASLSRPLQVARLVQLRSESPRAGGAPVPFRGFPDD